jgi:TRAP-type C4-dicarboxylate transport system permease small subunit
LGGYFLVVLVFLGMGSALHDGALFRVTVVLRALPRRGRQALQLIFDLLSLAFAVLLTWQMARLVHGSYVRHVRADSILQTPLYIPQIVMVVGSASMTLVLAGQCLSGFLAVSGREPGSKS